MLHTASELLDRKRQILVQRVVELVPCWNELRTRVEARLAEAYGSFRITRMRSTSIELRQVVEGMPPVVAVEFRRELVSGVPTFRVRTERQPARPRFGLLGSTAELDRTVRLLGDATEVLAQLAAAEGTLRSLTRVLIKTNRQVRTLRDSLIPAYDATIRSIEEALEEEERTYLFQLKRIGGSRTRTQGATP